MIYPLADRVLVCRTDPEEITRGGLAIPEKYRDATQEAIVVAVGEGRVSDDGKVFPVAVRVGDRVLLAKYGGTDILLDGEELVIVREEEILGIIAPVAVAKLAVA
jgi:chaperonin GroES